MKKKNNIFSIREFIKKKFKTHTLESAIIYPNSEELSEEQLDKVIGGMGEKTFEIWRINTINEIK